MQGRSRMAQNRMQDVKRATGAQVRGQLDDQDSQNRKCSGQGDFKIGAESYAQRQNKVPGRKYVVSWMT